MPHPVTARFVAAVLLTAAASVAVPAGSAMAASCSSADGVTVVVDFKGLGGGVQQACAASGGGKSAASLFTGNGFPLAYVQNSGFVCRVSGVPDDDPCARTPPADAYWGLWWSDGESGSWSYASEGAGSLKIPEGGYVAFAWDGESGSPPPGVAPTAHAAEPAPTPSSQPTSAPTRSPSPGGGSAPTPDATAPGQAPSDSTLTSPSDTTSVEPSSSPSATKSTKPEESDSSTASSATSASTPASDPTVPVASDPPGTDAGLPSWVGPLLIGALFAAAAVAALVRRRRGSTGP